MRIPRIQRPHAGAKPLEVSLGTGNRIIVRGSVAKTILFRMGKKDKKSKTAEQKARTAAKQEKKAVQKEKKGKSKVSTDSDQEDVDLDVIRAEYERKVGVMYGGRVLKTSNNPTWY